MSGTKDHGPTDMDIDGPSDSDLGGDSGRPFKFKFIIEALTRTEKVVEELRVDYKRKSIEVASLQQKIKSLEEELEVKNARQGYLSEKERKLRAWEKRLASQEQDMDSRMGCQEYIKRQKQLKSGERGSNEAQYLLECINISINNFLNRDLGGHEQDNDRPADSTKYPDLGTQDDNKDRVDITLGKKRKGGPKIDEEHPEKKHINGHKKPKKSDIDQIDRTHETAETDRTVEANGTRGTPSRRSARLSEKLGGTPGK